MYTFRLITGSYYIARIAVNSMIYGLNHSLTGGFMDPDPTPLPRWRYVFFR
ncbi:mgtA regulatory leader peptide MgtL [Citrobacter rodentium NBRC 105723 = DSM 16636]|nr:mgtA regulatory leader peptide MgtL [Citrobacter rodentium NBRC 105723 = DSM 16636]